MPAVRHFLVNKIKNFFGFCGGNGQIGADMFAKVYICILLQLPLQVER